MSTAVTELTKQQSSVELIATQTIRTVSSEQRSKIDSILKLYLIQLGTTRQSFGSIDLATGFTHSLINSVVKNCEYISSVDHRLLTFTIWDVLHAHAIVQVVNNEVLSTLILALPEPLANPNLFSLIWDSHIWSQFNM